MSQDNVVILDPETEEITKHTDTPMNAEHIQELKESYETFPEPTASAGKGKKFCPNCHFLLGARSTECTNCGWAFVKGAAKASKPSGSVSRSPRATGSHKAVEAPRIDSLAVYKVLKGRGFELNVTIDALDPAAKPTVTCEKDLQGLIDVIQSDAVELISTTPSIRFSVGLDEMLKLLKVKERR